MILISPIDQKPVWCRSFPYFRKTYQKVCLIHKQACRPVRVYLEVGTTVRSQPRAVATFKSVSSCGITFLLSNRAITDCVRQAALAKSFCVIPLLCRCLISRSIKAAQFSGIYCTPDRRTIFIQIFRSYINTSIIPTRTAVINIDGIKYIYIL